jgi:SNF2 family DNA or RNA helicase
VICTATWGETIVGANAQGAVEADGAEIGSCGNLACRRCARMGVDKCMLCPASRMQLAEDGVIVTYSKADLEVNLAAAIKSERQILREGLKRSSKINSLLLVLSMIPATDKAIVFLQWTSALTIMEHFCKKEGFQTRMVNGTMSTKEQAVQLQEFATNAEVPPSFS